MFNLSIASPGTVETFRRVSFSAASISSSLHVLRIHHQVSARMPAATSRKPVVVMMSKREAELKDIRAKTTEELNEKVVDLKGELFMLRLQKSARNEFKSSEFRRMKKQDNASSQQSITKRRSEGGNCFHKLQCRKMEEMEQ